MHKIKLFSRAFCALGFLVLGACSGGGDDAEIGRIFLKHSRQAQDKKQVESLLDQYGPEGLKKLDPLCELYYPLKKHVLPPFVDAASHAGFVAEVDGAALLVDKVFKGSPAYAAGISEGDRIIRINGKPPSLYGPLRLNGFLEDVNGWDIVVDFVRKGASAPLKAQLARKPPIQPLIWSAYREKSNTLYVRINSFSKGSAWSLEKILSSPDSRRARRLVLDLRHASGGLFDELRSALELFAPKGALLFSIQARVEGYRAVFTSAREPLPLPSAISVIIDGDTSGAPEIFALSLRRNAGAIITGRASAGRFSILKTFRVSKSLGLTMTVAALAGPDGLSAAGVKPDIESATEWSSAYAGFAPAQILEADPAFLAATGNRSE